MKNYLSALMLACTALHAQTSLSDNGSYPQFCMEAAEHDEVFQNFRTFVSIEKFWSIRHMSKEKSTYRLSKKTPPSF